MLTIINNVCTVRNIGSLGRTASGHSVELLPERFKLSVNAIVVHGLSVRQWCRIFASEGDESIKETLKVRLNISDLDAEKLIH